MNIDVNGDAVAVGASFVFSVFGLMGELGAITTIPFCLACIAYVEADFGDGDASRRRREGGL